MRGAMPLLPNTPSWHGAQLKKGQEDLYLIMQQKLIIKQYCHMTFKLTSCISETR